jgi:hypothetical protein
MYSLITVINVFKVLVHKSFISFIKSIPTYFILMPFLYWKIINFCLLILHPVTLVTLMNSFSLSHSLFVNFSTYLQIELILFLPFQFVYLLFLKSYLIILSTATIILNRRGQRGILALWHILEENLSISTHLRWC